MATLSQYLFATGAIVLLLAFVTAVAYTTLLATSRRALAAQPTSVRAGSLTLAPATAGADGGMVSSGRRGSDASATAAAIAHGLTWVSVVLLAASLASRAIIVGRGPWGNMYEFSIAFAVGILGGYLVLEHRYAIRSLAFLPLGVALFLAGYAASLPATIEPLVPALDNAPLLTVHVAMAMIAYGVLAISFAAAIGYLVQGEGDRFAWLPGHDVLDAVAYRSVILGFPVFATMIVLGSYWASIAWGRYWGWDPKETSALVTWLIYAVYLHLRSRRAWAGRPAALVLVIGFAAVLFTYFGNLFFSGLHAYSGL
jgi:cytochrome c-type biogenesis protein CcsB